MKPVQLDLLDAPQGRASGEPRHGRGSPQSSPASASVRHCKICGLCDPLPEGVSWATNTRCSNCVGGAGATLGRSEASPEASPLASVARAAYQTEPCPVKGCRGWHHPLATMCDACKTLLPEELRLALMRAASMERRPQLAERYGPLDRPALQKQAIEAASARRSGPSGEAKLRPEARPSASDRVSRATGPVAPPARPSGESGHGPGSP